MSSDAAYRALVQRNPDLGSDWGNVGVPEERNLPSGLLSDEDVARMSSEEIAKFLKDHRNAWDAPHMREALIDASPVQGARDSIEFFKDYYGGQK